MPRKVFKRLDNLKNARLARWSKNNKLSVKESDSLQPAEDAVPTFETTRAAVALDLDDSVMDVTNNIAISNVDAAEDERTIIELSLLIEFAMKFKCTNCCGLIKASINKAKSKGFAKCIEVYCGSCDEVVNTLFTSRRTDKDNIKSPFQVNKDIVAASIMCDLGPYKLNKFSEVLNLPSLHQSTFSKKARQIYDNINVLRDVVLGKARLAVREAYQHNDVNTPLDIAVSFDGTWLTRGHSSLIGVGCVVEVITGLTLDFHVVSLHCQVFYYRRIAEEKMPHRICGLAQKP